MKNIKSKKNIKSNSLFSKIWAIITDPLTFLLSSAVLLVALLIVMAIQEEKSNPIIGTFRCDGLEGGAKSIVFKRVRKDEIYAEEGLVVTLAERRINYTKLYNFCTKIEDVK